MKGYKQYRTLYAIFLSMLPVLGILFYLNESQQWDFSRFLLFFAVLIMMVSIHGCYSMRKQPLLYVAIGAAVIAAAVILSYNREFLGKHLEAERMLIRLGLILCAGVVSYVVSKVHLLRVALAVAFVITAIAMGGLEFVFTKLGAAAIGTYCTMVLIEVVLNHTVKNKRKRRLAVVTLFPVYVIVFLLLLLVPVREERLKWNMIRSAMSQISRYVVSIQDYINNLRDERYGEFSIGMSGYSEDGKVGGTIAQSDKEALKLTASEPKTRGLYIVGSYKDTYEENAWTSTIKEEDYPLSTSESSLDTMELLYSLYRYNGCSNLDQYIHRSSMRISYEGIRTKSIFRMEKMKSITYAISDRERIPSMLEPSFDGLAGDETFYDLEYYEISTRSKQFEKLIEEEQNYIYKEEETQDITPLQAIARDKGILQYVSIPGDLEQKLAVRRRFVYDYYTGINHALKDKIQDLTLDVTKDASGIYEKLLAIEQYLHRFTYTTTPKQLKKGEDAVYSFLFDSHEGYCTYFASAMTLMARSIGIPARYVQGYVVPADSKGWYDYTVREKQAHAWTQAYIDGVGWIAFEPTAGYCMEESDFGQEKANKENKKAPLAVPSPSIQKDERPVEVAQESAAERNWGVLIASTVLFLLTMVCAGIWLRIYSNRRTYRKADPTGKYYYEVLRMQWLLRKFSYNRAESETWEHYIKRVRDGIGDRLPLLLTVKESYSKVRYHKEEATEKDLTDAMENNKQILALLKERVKWLRLLLIRLQLEMISAKNMEGKSETD